MSSPSPLFRFVQVEFPWPLGPPDGRYLVRAPTPPAEAQAAPSHVIVFVTLGAPERRRLARRRRTRDAEPGPDPAPVTTGRATIIDAADPLASTEQARSWLDAAGDDELDRGLRMLNWGLHAFRLVTADPYLQPVARRQAIIARIGFGAGEQVADGLWTAARELVAADGRVRRAKLLSPQARLAAVLGGRELPLACEELALRARLDLDHGRPREAALQLLVTLDAAIAELTDDPHAAALADRITELRGLREGTAGAAQAALSGPLAPEQTETVSLALARVEAALRARAAAGS